MRFFITYLTISNRCKLGFPDITTAGSTYQTKYFAPGEGFIKEKSKIVLLKQQFNRGLNYDPEQAL